MQPPATDCPGAPAMRQPSAPPWDVADLFRLSGETYRRAHAVPPAQQKVMRDLEACRTAQRGGHAEPCPTCGFERDADHACRNRHCPKCQTFTKVQRGEDPMFTIREEDENYPYIHFERERDSAKMISRGLEPNTIDAREAAGSRG